MKKALSVILALAVALSAFALCLTASASEDLDVTIFSASFGGRKGFNDVWGQIVNMKVGNAAAKTYNGNNYLTDPSLIPELENDGAVLSADENGNIRMTSYGATASAIGTSLWNGLSSNTTSQWVAAYEEIVSKRGNAKVEGLSLQYTVTNNGDGVVSLSADIIVPGVKAHSGAPITYDIKGNAGNFYGANEYIWPGETVTFEYALDAQVEDSEGNIVDDEFLEEDVERGDSGRGVSVLLNAINDSSYNSAANKIDITMSPIKIVTTTDNVIAKDNAPEFMDRPQVSTEKPVRPYRTSTPTDAKPGDVDLNDLVNLADVRAAIVAIANNTVADLDAKAFNNGDVNKDGNFNLSDVRLIVGAIANNDFSGLK